AYLSPDRVLWEFHERQDNVARLLALKHFPFVIKGNEEISETANSLGRAEKQEPAGIQGVMKQGHEMSLCLGIQVNQQVAAREQVDLGKGWVREQVLLGKHHHFPDLLLDAIAVVLSGEIALQPFRAHIDGNAIGVEPGPGFLDRLIVQISRKDLHQKLSLQLV